MFKFSYAVKYASNFYGPFRDAVGSKKSLKSDKKIIKWTIQTPLSPKGGVFRY